MSYHGAGEPSTDHWRDKPGGASPNEGGPKLRSAQGETTPDLARAGRLGTHPYPSQEGSFVRSPPGRRALSGPLLGGVGVGRFIERQEDSAARPFSFRDARQAGRLSQRDILGPHLQAFILILPDHHGKMVEKLGKDLAADK